MLSLCDKLRILFLSQKYLISGFICRLNMPAHSWHFFQTFDVVRVGKKNQSYFQPQAGESELFSSKMVEDQNAELFVSN